MKLSHYIVPFLNAFYDGYPQKREADGKSTVYKTLEPITTTIKGVTKTVQFTETHVLDPTPNAAAPAEPATITVFTPTPTDDANNNNNNANNNDNNDNNDNNNNDNNDNAGNGCFGVQVDGAGDSPLQSQTIKKVDAHPHVFLVGGGDGADLKLTLNGDGSLSDQDGREVFVGTNGDFGNVSPWGSVPGTTGFSIKDGKLAYHDCENFFACPSGENQFSLAVSGWNGCTTIQLKVF